MEQMVGALELWPFIAIEGEVYYNWDRKWYISEILKQNRWIQDYDPPCSISKEWIQMWTTTPKSIFALMHPSTFKCGMCIRVRIRTWPIFFSNLARNYGCGGNVDLGAGAPTPPISRALCHMKCTSWPIDMFQKPKLNFSVLLYSDKKILKKMADLWFKCPSSRPLRGRIQMMSITSRELRQLHALTNVVHIELVWQETF